MTVLRGSLKHNVISETKEYYSVLLFVYNSIISHHAVKPVDRDSHSVKSTFELLLSGQPAHLK